MYPQRGFALCMPQRGRAISGHRQLCGARSAGHRLARPNRNEVLFVVQPPARQWENLSKELDRCLVFGDRPQGDIFITCYAHTITGYTDLTNKGKCQGRLTLEEGCTVGSFRLWISCLPHLSHQYTSHRQQQYRNWASTLLHQRSKCKNDSCSQQTPNTSAYSTTTQYTLSRLYTCGLSLENQKVLQGSWQRKA